MYMYMYNHELLLGCAYVPPLSEQLIYIQIYTNIHTYIRAIFVCIYLYLYLYSPAPPSLHTRPPFREAVAPCGSVPWRGQVRTSAPPTHTQTKGLTLTLIGNGNIM